MPSTFINLTNVITYIGGAAGATYGAALAYKSTKEHVFETLDFVETACTYCLYGLLWPVSISYWAKKRYIS